MKHIPTITTTTLLLAALLAVGSISVLTPAAAAEEEQCTAGVLDFAQAPLFHSGMKNLLVSLYESADMGVSDIVGYNGDTDIELNDALAGTDADSVDLYGTAIFSYVWDVSSYNAAVEKSTKVWNFHRRLMVGDILEGEMLGYSYPSTRTDAQKVYDGLIAEYNDAVESYLWTAHTRIGNLRSEIKSEIAKSKYNTCRNKLVTEVVHSLLIPLMVERSVNRWHWMQYEDLVDTAEFHNRQSEVLLLLNYGAPTSGRQLNGEGRTGTRTRTSEDAPPRTTPSPGEERTSPTADTHIVDEPADQ